MDIIGNISGYFEEVETTEDYDGYWYCVRDIIVISIIGSIRREVEINGIVSDELLYIQP